MSTLATLDRHLNPTVEPEPPRVRYVIGLDLGQLADYSALVIVKEGRDPAKDDPPSLDVVHLKRYDLGTPYPAIIADVRDLVADPRLTLAERRPELVIDATGVGRPCVDMFKQAKLAARLKAVTITGGLQWSHVDALNYHVPKKDIVGAIQAALSSGRLKVVPSLELADVLKAELLNFKVKVSEAGNELFACWREGQHDDLVLAAGVAIWTTTQHRIGRIYDFGVNRSWP